MKSKLIKKDVFLGVYIDQKLKNSIIDACNKKRITLSQFLREAIIEKLEKEMQNGSKETN